MMAQSTTLRERIPLPDWLVWTLATAAGHGLGMTISAVLVSGLARLGPLLWGVPNVLIYGAVIGIMLGIMQGAVMPQRLAAFRAWLLATAAGSALGYAVAAVVCERIGNALSPTHYVIAGQGIVSAIAGVIIGLGIGFGQWLTFRRHRAGSGGWVMISSIGMGLGALMAAVLLGLFEIEFFRAAPSTAVGVIMGCLIGLLQGLVLYRNRDHWRNESQHDEL